MEKLTYDNRHTQTSRDLFEFIKKIKSRDMRTNSIFTLPALEELCDNSAAWISIGATAAIILVPDTENIVRLYYYAENKTALNELSVLLPTISAQVVCDIVGKEPVAENQAKELMRIGFSTYAKFQRMICNSPSPDKKLDFSEVTLAKEADAEEIYQILHQEFDPLTARFPDIEALRQKAVEEEIFVVRRQQKIAGFSVFSSQNKRVSLLEYIIVRPEFRKEKIAKKLVHFHWMYKRQRQYYLLWINSQCVGPIQFHVSNGFLEDGTYDYILLLPKSV